MPNPRFMSYEGVPTPELLDKLQQGKSVFEANLEWFCDKYGYNISELRQVDLVFLIGSHAEEKEWNNRTSDVDFKLVNMAAIPENLHRYKREVLDKLLHIGEKREWIDLFFVGAEYQVSEPKFNVTKYWAQFPSRF